MKKKIFLIASHGNLAKGFQSSLDILADKGKESGGHQCLCDS